MSERRERIQSLWGGYGELLRVHRDDGSTVIVKEVTPPARPASDVSHARKCRSYDVETAFYRSHARRCTDACRVPALVASDASAGKWRLVLEDLDAAGYAGRRRRVDERELDACLAWLASFHATFLGVAPDGLWPTGTYWHLATRRDELDAIEDRAIRDAADEWNRALEQCPFKTLVHGDPKPANFCFGERGVAAVDFQYVGGGCGMKDVAYLLSGASASGEEVLDARWLDVYFAHLARPEVERAWRPLFAIACADFYRFYAGWAPHAWRHDAVGHRVVSTVIRGG